MKILNFGSCNIDYVYSLDHIVKVGETETTYKMNVFPGGKGLNQSIAAAADMLLNTEMPVCEIAERVGYENKSFFRKIFKEKYGKNPLEFRKTSSL